MKNTLKDLLRFLLCVATVVVCALGCGVQKRKLENIRTQELGATLALDRQEIVEENRVIASKRDTIIVKDDSGNEQFLMHAVKDDETGEMVATEMLDAVIITARFRNVAERHGKIDLRFEVIVPQSMQDTKWQLRFYPDMYIMSDTLALEPVIITGADYRKGQLRGYEQYERFLRTIITDNNFFVDLRNLEIFIARNIPEVYKFKNDTTFVSDEEFRSYYGVTEREAIEHYTNHFGVYLNERRKARRDRMYAKYIKVPIETEGIRLDTVIRDFNGDFIYHYTETINTRPKLRKVDVVLNGEIFESDKKLYTMTPTEPLTFYISSLSAFTDNTERYLTKTISRRAAANTACYVDFAQGKYVVDMRLGNNESELGRIKGNIHELLANTTFDLDSIVVAASASPEGSVKANNVLSVRRAAAVCNYFNAYIKEYRDSVQAVLDREAEGTVVATIDENGREVFSKAKAKKADIPDIKFLSRSNGENWPMLSLLIDRDSVMTRAQKKAYIDLLAIQDLDKRERELSKHGFYTRLRKEFYPRLRTVKFDFFLHRKGMIQETVQTTELDTVYMKGVEHLREREYEEALKYLKDYRDYNTAIAYVSLDYNASAMNILQELDKTPQVNYMMALLYARQGDDQKAVQHYLDACREEPSYVFRGNLDPEIYILIQRYGLNKDDFDDYN